MEVQFQNNSLSVSHQNKIYQLHPVWLRERLPGDEYFDIDTHQRLYEPSSNRFRSTNFISYSF